MYTIITYSQSQPLHLTKPCASSVTLQNIYFHCFINWSTPWLIDRRHKSQHQRLISQTPLPPPCHCLHLYWQQRRTANSVIGHVGPHYAALSTAVSAQQSWFFHPPCLNVAVVHHCLVFSGCWSVIPFEVHGRSSHTKQQWTNRAQSQLKGL